MNTPLCFECGSPAQYVGANVVENCTNKKCRWRTRVFAWALSEDSNRYIEYKTADGESVFCDFVTTSPKHFAKYSKEGHLCLGEVRMFVANLAPKNKYIQKEFITYERYGNSK